jgi:hypothetical protein
MAFTPSTIDLTYCKASATPFELPFTLFNTFSQMMQSQLQLKLQLQLVIRKGGVLDRCYRPSLTYNFNYNPYNPLCNNLLKGYLPYVFGEPLHNNREVILSRLLE